MVSWQSRKLAIKKAGNQESWQSRKLAIKKAGNQERSDNFYINFKESASLVKILTVTGYKGGVGKSTTAFHLAAYFSRFGETVLVDGDPNRTAVKWAERGNLANLTDGSEGKSRNALNFVVADERQAMRIVQHKEFIIIDTPARPDSEDLNELAKGCDLLILPTSPDIVSLEPMLQTAQALGDAARYRALITLVPPYPSKEGELMRDELRAGGIPVCETMIRRTTGFTKAAFAGRPIGEIKEGRAQVAWGDYLALGDEIKEIIK